MFGEHATAARVFGLVIIGGVVTTGLSFLVLNPFLRYRKKDDGKNSVQNRHIRSPSDYDEINSREESKFEAATDAPLDFRIVIHGGAGVVSKGIDSKPFFDSLTRIMADAYNHAKSSENTVTGERKSNRY